MLFPLKEEVSEASRILSKGISNILEGNAMAKTSLRLVNAKTPFPRSRVPFRERVPKKVALVGGIIISSPFNALSNLLLALAKAER
jgi:hypothetical protein